MSSSPPDPQNRYKVPGSPEPESVCAELPGAPGAPPIGPVVTGYGAELVGHTHQVLEEGAAVVHLPRDTRYMLRLSNANNYLVLVKVDIDEVHVGTFLLNPYMFCDLERPLDRPLGFTFCHAPKDEPSPTAEKSGGSGGVGSGGGRNPAFKSSRRKTIMPSSSSSAGSVDPRTMIKCTFQPELGARTMELDIRAHGMDQVKRYELARDLAVSELFRDLARDFRSVGDDPTLCLLHWTNAEYDSPMEEVLTPAMDVHIGNSLRKDDPLRKMTLVVAHKLCIRHEDGQEVVLDLTRPPRFADVMKSMTSDFTVGGPKEDIQKEKPLYLLTRSGRVLGSSAWFPREAFVFELFHKDELLESLPYLHIDVTSKPPKGIFSIFVRVLKGGMHELQATKDTSLRELNLQMANRGGPYRKDVCWLFCGKFLEPSKPLSHYDIRPRNTVDILIRSQGREDTTLRKEDPIAVEEAKPISSSYLLHKSPAGSSSTPGDGPLRRRGTTLHGRSTQQFMEVDPISTDERFFTGVTLQLVPDDEELLSAVDTLDGLTTPTGSGCATM